MNIFKILAPVTASLLLASCGTMNNVDSYDDQHHYYDNRYPNNEVSFNHFYNSLSPYGNWINYPGLGQVWQVNDPFFRPYVTNGHWAYSPYGWTWVSGYEWGATPFHYGSWAYDRFHGWLWVPGYQWAPAWVTWRSYGSYYGWSPVMAGGYNGYDHWAFVPDRYLTSMQLNNHMVQQSKVPEFVRNSTTLGNTIPGRNTSSPHVSFTGPEIEKVKQVAITPVQTLGAEAVDQIVPKSKKATTAVDSRVQQPGVSVLTDKRPRVQTDVTKETTVPVEALGQQDRLIKNRSPKKQKQFEEQHEIQQPDVENTRNVQLMEQRRVHREQSIQQQRLQEQQRQMQQQRIEEQRRRAEAIEQQRAMREQQAERRRQQLEQQEQRRQIIEMQQRQRDMQMMREQRTRPQAPQPATPQPARPSGGVIGPM